MPEAGGRLSEVSLAAVVQICHQILLTSPPALSVNQLLLSHHIKIWSELQYSAYLADSKTWLCKFKYQMKYKNIYNS